MIVQSEFRPRWWLSNPHLQTIIASKLSAKPKIDSEHLRVELADGDFLDLHLSLASTGPLVCIFHGLAGCLDSNYARGAIAALEKRGFRPVFMHWRGCSGEPNRLPISYHSGATTDIRWLIHFLSARFPAERIYAVGFSLGGNALLKYLGESGNNSHLDGAAAICPPLMLNIGADKMNRGLARGYQRYLLALMRNQHEAKRRRYPELNLPPAKPSLNSFWRFDDAITAPLHGFVNVHDYYTKCSARPYLQSIRTPTRILYALDDPFFTRDVVPHQNEMAQSVTLELAKHGGHVGFISHKDQTEPWLDNWVGSAISGLHQDAV